MNRTTRNVIFATAALVLGSMASSTFAADNNWQKNHPRRTEVNKRLANQNTRIKQEVKGGDMTKGQARKLHREDRQIRREERTMASQNGGHITKQEQKTLNQQENAVSRQIGK
jgi:hypothetical protein